jgi:hypothetical protein
VDADRESERLHLRADVLRRWCATAAATARSGLARTARWPSGADKWLESLERKETTVDSYRSTIAYAMDTFGHVLVRRLGSGLSGT